MIKLEELKKEIEELQSTLENHNKTDAEYNSNIETNNKKLTEYMKQNNYDNETISRYKNINNLLELTFEQTNIKDINILKHIINKLYIAELKNNNKQLIKLYNKQLKVKQDQLKELNKYGRIFTV